MPFFSSWQAFALGSAFFAGLTAILGKLAVVFLGEALTLKLAAGGTLILVGVLVLAWP